MGSEKFSVSASQELFAAIERLREDREQDRSSLIEVLLREHPLVRREIRRQRRGGRPPGRRGRDSQEMSHLVRSARRQWDKQVASGEVAFLDR